MPPRVKELVLGLVAVCRPVGRAAVKHLGRVPALITLPTAAVRRLLPASPEVRGSGGAGVVARLVGSMWVPVLVIL